MLDGFVVQRPRPLPVIVLADCSGSMQGPKIAALNAAMRELAQDLSEATTPQGEIHIGLITFANGVDTHPPVPAGDFTPPELRASGRTAMGGAVDALRELLDDRERLPTRAYTPTVVLISDGVPTDHFESALRALLDDERGRRATRMALAIGDDADVGLLGRFIDHPEIPVIQAQDVSKIRDFFQWVSFSVQARSRSRNPNQQVVAPPQAAGLDDDDLVF